MNTTKQAELLPYLYYSLVTLSSLTAPISFLNLYLLLRQDALHRPSHFIYLNLIILSALNALQGAVTAGNIHQPQDSLPIKRHSQNIFVVTFSGEIILLFGLSIIRLLALKLAPGTILIRLRHVAYGVVTGSWVIGGVMLLMFKLHVLPWQGHLTINIMMFSIVTVTGAIHIYIMRSVRDMRGEEAGLIEEQRRVGEERGSLYARANNTARLLFLSFLSCYLYFVFSLGYDIYIIVYLDRKCPCEGWLALFACGSAHEIGLGCMLVQGLGNNLILIGQREVRQWMRRRVMSLRQRTEVVPTLQVNED